MVIFTFSITQSVNQSIYRVRIAYIKSDGIHHPSFALIVNFFWPVRQCLALPLNEWITFQTNGYKYMMNAVLFCDLHIKYKWWIFLVVQISCNSRGNSFGPVPHILSVPEKGVDTVTDVLRDDEEPSWMIMMSPSIRCGDDGEKKRQWSWKWLKFFFLRFSHK